MLKNKPALSAEGETGHLVNPKVSRRKFIQLLSTGVTAVSLSACITSVKSVKKKSPDAKSQKEILLSLKKFPLRKIYKDGIVLGELFKLVGHNKLSESGRQEEFFDMTKKYLGDDGLYTLKEAFSQTDKKAKVSHIIRLLQTQINLISRHIQSDGELLRKLKKSRKVSQQFVIATEFKIQNAQRHMSNLIRFCSNVKKYQSVMTDF